MISLQELNPKNNVLSPSHLHNLTILHERINKVRTKYGVSMVITSGFRSIADHKRIYADLAKKKGSEVIRVPMGSKHLSARACDVYDPSGALMLWCKLNEPFLAEVGLWLEDGTRGWVHFQCEPPASGKRFFKP